MPINRNNLSVGQVFRGTQPIKAVYKGTQKIYEVTGTAPTITSFGTNPMAIDRDLSPPVVNVALVFRITNCTSAHIVNVATGYNVGPNYTTGTGNINQTLTTTAPTENTTYRLIAQRVATNHNVSVTEDRTITVQQDYVISNFRRVSFQQVPLQPSSGVYVFAFRIVGTPQPNRFVFSGAFTLTTDTRHLTKVSGQINTWDFSIRVTIPISPDRALSVHASGSGGSTIATLNSINT